MSRNRQAANLEAVPDGRVPRVANEFHIWLGERGEDGSIVPMSTDTIITPCDLDDRPIVVFAREDIFAIASWLSSLPSNTRAGT